MPPGPSRSFTEALERLADTAGASRVFDSRLEILCARWKVDPEPRRKALREGRNVAFCKIRGGRTIPVHVIKPDDVR